MAEAVILSAIESLDGWLLKQRGLVEESNLEKLDSLIVGMPDFGEEKKEMEYGDSEELFNLLDLNKEKMYNLVVGMVDFWEDYQVKLYRFLFWLAERDEGEVNKENAHSLLVEITDLWGAHYVEVNKEKVKSLLVEITDLWGDDEGELDKEKLHSLLFQMVDKDNYSDGLSKIKMMSRMSGEVAGLWKDKQPKLNKEKLYTWLANKLDHVQNQYPLFSALYDIVHDSLDLDEVIRDGVDSMEGAKREFRMILDLIRDKKLGEETSLRYFISDVVDMAHHAHSLIQLKDSDPFTLFFQLKLILVPEMRTYPKWFGKKFEYIMRGLQEIKVSMLGFGVERLQNVTEMEGGENVVGLEEDVKLLLSDECNNKITVIKGMVGSGKTTLARQLYNHATIAQQFERRAWVCFSKFFSRKEMLVSLIRQVVDSNQLASLEKIECADYETLKQVLGMRYFIVLDDVCDTTHCKYIMKALRREYKRNRFLLTSRTMNTEYVDTMNIDYEDVKYHKMKSMDADKSWRLLLKTLSIEGIGEEFPKPLVNKARQILRKCGGLPLAIKEVGRNWAKDRHSGREWEELVESINLSETLRALEPCYHNLNEELKSCFLHLAFFKEGTTIKAKKLVQIWDIMGVVLSEWKGMVYLEELSEESIIDVIDRGKDGWIKKCCIHVVFHMLSIIKAEYEINFEIIGKDGNNRPSHEPHHRTMYCSREKLMNYSSNQDKHLVSLFLYGGGYFNCSPSYWNHFEQLKTLDMEDFGLKILPDVIGMLTELRYLGLRNNYIQELPHSLSRLKKLEVLDIALNFMVEVEDIIWEMESLRHLYMSDISSRKPLRIDTLDGLKTLMYISVHNWTYNASRFNGTKWNLTKLGIQELDKNTNVTRLFASLYRMNCLEFLILRGFRFKRMPGLNEIGILRNLVKLKLEGLITRLPRANKFPPYIKHLSLVNSCLHEDPMPILEKLSNLTYLKLQNAYNGQQMVISHNGFSYLKFLVIKELWHLTNVQIEKGAMMSLKDLEINNCPNLETLPQDYIPLSYMMFKMKTTKKNATKIRESSFVSSVREVGKVDIQP